MSWNKCEHYEMHPKVWDERPYIYTPMIEEDSMLKSDWVKQYGNIPSLPFATFDCEAWADATKPVTWSAVIVDSYGPIREGIIGGDFVLDDKGERVKDKNGKYKWTVNKDKWNKKWKRCEKHKKTKNTNAMRACKTCSLEVSKPKNIGKYWTSKDEKKTRIRITKFWCWNDELEERLIPLLIEKGVKKVYAHNATYDIIAILSTLEPTLSHPLEYFIQKDNEDKSRILFRGSRILTSTFEISKYYNKGKHEDDHYREIIYDYNEKKYVGVEKYDIEIVDSAGLIPLPLFKIGEAIGYSKGSTPEIFTNKEHINYGNIGAITDEMIDYNIRDCEVLFWGLQQFYRQVKGLGYHGSKLPLTSGTLGSQMIGYNNVTTMKPISTLYQKKKKHWKYECIVNEPELDDICRLAMVGGRTQVFVDTEIEGNNVYGIDANSMYPSQQCDENNTYPDFRNMKALTKWDSKLIDTKEGCVYVGWKRPDNDKIGLLSARNERGTLDWTLEEGERWITFAEYRKAIEENYSLNVKVDKESGYCAIVMNRLNYNPFGIVKEWYELRLQMKADNDPNEFCIKILLNSGGFGKYVERNKDTVLIEEQDMVSLSGDWEFSGVSQHDGLNYGYANAEEFKRADTTANIMGAYITAYARINLYDVGKAIGHEHLLYCDTDSWKHTNPDVICPFDGDDLGEWKLENISDYWWSVAPKQYKYHQIQNEDGEATDKWVARIKGVNLRNMDAEHVNLKGEVVYPHLTGIKESWRRGTTAGEWVEIKKNIGGA